MATLIEPNRPRVEATLPSSGLQPEAESNAKLFSVVSTGDSSGCTIQSEQPWHTLAAKYLALGMSTKETAELCDCTPVMISVLLRNEWFQTRVTQFMEKADVSILSLFKSAALGAFTTLVEINQNEKAPASVRVAAAKEILDRHLGKSTQFMEIKATDKSANVVEEVRKIEEDIAREAGALFLKGPGASL